MKLGFVTKTKTRAGLAALAGLALAANVLANLSIGIQFPDIVMEKLAPGGVYNLRQLRSVDLSIINGSDRAVEVVVESVAPVPGTLKDGYETIADPAWLTIVPNQFVLEKDARQSADVILTLPEDPALMGRHFQARIKARSLNTGTFSAAVSSMLRFSVGAEGPETVKRRQEAEALKALGPIDLQLTPASLTLARVPLGRRVAVSELAGKGLKLTNRGGKKLTLDIAAAKVDNSQKVPGYDAGDPQWLAVKPARLTLKPDTIKDLGAALHVPDDPANAGKKFMLILKASLADSLAPVEWRAVLLIETEAKK